jgi:hypothetical protein
MIYRIPQDSVGAMLQLFTKLGSVVRTDEPTVVINVTIIADSDGSRLLDTPNILPAKSKLETSEAAPISEASIGNSSKRSF